MTGPAGPWLRRVAHAATVVLAFCGLLSTRAVLEARAHHQEAQRALRAGDVEAGLGELAASARWYAPLNPFVAASLRELLAAGARAERRGDTDLALSAYRAVHAAVHAGRSLYVPHRALLTRADGRIAALMAAERPAEIDAERSVAERRALYSESLEVPRPRVFPALLGLCGYATWAVATWLFARWGVSPAGGPGRRAARAPGLLALLGALCFALGMGLA